MRSDDGLTFTEQARRAQIVDAAVQVIATDGYAQASLAKIANHIGVAKSVVLYHFKTKNDIIEAVVTSIFLAATIVMVPAMAAETTAKGRLAAYIRSNIRFIDGHRTAAMAMLEIITGYRSPEGLRLDQAAAESVKAHPPEGDMALLDPQTIFEDGLRNGEFRSLTPLFMKSALRAALDGAVWEIARDPEYDLTGYGEELVAVFGRATEYPST